MRRLPVPLVALALASGNVQGEQAAVSVDMPSQWLSLSLERLAKTAGLQLLYSADALVGKKAEGLSGTYPPHQALEKLLQGSGLEYRFVNGYTAIIRPPPGLKPARAAPLSAVVVTATRTERSASEVPATLAVVDRRQISQTYNRDLSDALRRTAGLDVERSGTIGIATLNIRGLGVGRTSTLIDGQLADFLDSSIGNRSAIQTVDWDDVERVEVVRGAGSALYGPMAMGGVVNIITRDAAEGPRATRPFFQTDSLPTFGGGFTSGGTEGALGYFLDFKHLDSEGYRSAPEPAFAPSASGTTIHSLQSGSWKKNQAGGRLQWNPNDRASLKFGFNYLDDNALLFERAKTPMSARIGRYALDYSHWLRTDDQLTVNLTYRDHQTDMVFDAYYYPSSRGTAPATKMYEDARKLSGEIRNRWDIAEGNTLLCGFYGSQDWAHRRTVQAATKALEDRPRNDITNYALYGQYEWAWRNRLFATAGGRGEWFSYDLSNEVSPLASNRGFAVFNPRGGLRFTAGNYVSIRASVGTGFRPPDPFGMVGWQHSPRYQVLPNSSLRPEQSESYDLGVDMETPFGTKLSATGYYNDLTDYILNSYSFQDGKFTIKAENLGRVLSYGTELELQQRLSAPLSFFINYTHSLAEAASAIPENASGLPHRGRQLPLTPKNKAAFGLVYESSRFSARLEGRYVDRMFVTSDTNNDPDYALPSYLVYDFFFGYRHSLSDNEEIDISMGIKNLTNRRYETKNIDILSEPRVGYARLAFMF